METFSIGQLAKAVRVPVSTVRFYERIGLLKPDFRTGGNYRGYTAASLERLRFVRSAQATGLSLDDIVELLRLTHATETPCVDVLSLMRRRLAEIRERIKGLRSLEKVLAATLEGCCKGAGTDICQDACRLSGLDMSICTLPKKNGRQTA